MVNVPSGSGKRRTLVGQQVHLCQLNDGALTLKSKKNQQDDVAVADYLITVCLITAPWSAPRWPWLPPSRDGRRKRSNLAHRQAPAEADEANQGDEIARFGFG